MIIKTKKIIGWGLIALAIIIAIIAYNSCQKYCTFEEINKQFFQNCEDSNGMMTCSPGISCNLIKNYNYCIIPFAVLVMVCSIVGWWMIKSSEKGRGR